MMIMESHQLEMLPNSSVVSESLNPKPNSIVQTSGDLSKESRVNGKETMVVRQERSIGVVEVYIHQARDIHNICIYHKQDVYAKVWLTSDPETTVSTQTINGGGKNPVFNQSLRLDVGTIDSSLKCEIWMLSRVRNYLEDQLLGFALVPLCDVVLGNGGKLLTQEFSLSSSDLFHSPAGFVQLSVTYTGASPAAEVLEIPTPPPPPPPRAYVTTGDLSRRDSESEVLPISVPCEFDKIEFPDPKIVNENEMMVSEYFGVVPCANLEDSKSTESFGTTDNGKHLSSEDTSAQIEEEGIPMGGEEEVTKVETPLPTSVSTAVSSAISISGSSQSESDTPGASKPLHLLKDKIQDTGVGVAKKSDSSSSSSSSALPATTFAQPVISVKIIEPEQKMVQQEIVDMYMKSMQQFTESLAKMKLPLDIGNGPADSGDTGSDEKVPASMSNGRSPRVFYGSRAFF